MFKNFINNIKLSKLSYLLEAIEVRDFRGKINAYNKIKRMKITKEMGLLILNESNYEHTDDYSDFNISLSLISLVFNNYYDEYSEKLEEIFPKLTDESEYEILNLLSCTDNESAVLLYKKLVIKYFDKFDNIPTGKLVLNKNNYSLLFPDLFKVLKSDKVENNIFLLFNDFLNSGVVLEKDITKNKKVLQTAVNNILKKGINFKFEKDEYIMQNKDYIALRIFLETAIGMEFYVSNRTTSSNLDKLYKKKDNQLKLFILDNYVRKGKDISKIRLNTIAKDELSRYPLYSFLKFYNLERLMPKKYANNRELSESDLYINYSISNNYNVIPFDFKFIEEREFENYKYYIYKFKTRYNYFDEIKDPTTDYIFNNLSIDKDVLDKTIIEHIGISGGYNKDLDPSTIELIPKVILVDKYDSDENKVIESLLNYTKSLEPKQEEKISLITKIKNKFKKKEKFAKEETETVEKIGFLTKIKNKFKKKEKVVPTEVEVPVEKPVIVSEEKNVNVIDKVSEEEEYKKPSILRRIFSVNTLLLLIFIIFVCSFLVLLSYIFDMDIFNLKKGDDFYNTVNVDASKLEKDNMTEIPFNEIFNQEGSEYYVLFYKKEDKTNYHTYLNTILDNNYKFFYVDLNKEENKPIYGQNDTGFVISDDTLLKVRDREYEFYVVGKHNILREMNDYINDIKAAKEKEEAEKKAQEELKKKQEAEKTEENNEEKKEEE